MELIFCCLIYVIIMITVEQKYVKKIKKDLKYMQLRICFCIAVFIVWYYEGRSINKLQNRAIPLILKIRKI